MGEGTGWGKGSGGVNKRRSAAVGELDRLTHWSLSRPRWVCDREGAAAELGAGGERGAEMRARSENLSFHGTVSTLFFLHSTTMNTHLF